MEREREKESVKKERLAEQNIICLIKKVEERNQRKKWINIEDNVWKAIWTETA